MVSRYGDASKDALKARFSMNHNYGEVIELLSDDDEELQQSHQQHPESQQIAPFVLGATKDDVIQLLSSDEEEKDEIEESKLTVEKTAENAIKLKDSESDNEADSKTKRPFQIPQWKPRYRNVKQEERAENNIPIKQENEKNVIYIDIDSDEDTEDFAPRIGPSPHFSRMASGPNRRALTSVLHSSQFNRGEPETDSSDDEAVMKEFEATFKKKRRTLQESNEATDSGESVDESFDNSIKSIPEASFTPSKKHHQKLPNSIAAPVSLDFRGDSDSDERIGKNSSKLLSTSILKPPPTNPLSSRPIIKSSDWKAKGQLHKQQQQQPQTIASVPNQLNKEPTESWQLQSQTNSSLSSRFKNVPAKLRSPAFMHTGSNELSSSSASFSSQGTRCGADLRQIFTDALAQNKVLDIRNVSRPESSSVLERTKKLREPAKKHQPQVSHLRQRDTSVVSSVPKKSSNLSVPEPKTSEESLLNRDERLITGRITPCSDSKSSDDSDECNIDEMMDNEKNFDGGIDDPVREHHGPLDPSSMSCMEKIEHLSSLNIDKDTGLPFHKFSVFGFPDDIIYDFELHVKMSTIPDSGRGVFMTFLGARELRPSRKRWGRDLFAQREYRKPRWSEPITALHPNGFGMKVKLKGEHLFGPYNCYFTLPTLKARKPGRQSLTKVRFSNFEDPFCEEELAGLKREGDRIGLLGLYTESDYVPAPRRTFSSLHENCGTIDIGRYGPFQPSDRKIESHFNFKSFIFSNIPNEWTFDVEEKLRGQTQMIDITDDSSGEPHQFAYKNIPMYINEVGHDKTLKQTVHALSHEDRSVHYYLAIDYPMKPGDTIELFVAYQGFYETVRKRKGYALANLKGLEKSDDHLATYLKRNFRERKEMEVMVAALGPMDLYLLTDWLASIHDQLFDIIDGFMQGVKTLRGGSDSQKCPLVHQFVALRRYSWLSVLLKKHLAKATKNRKEPKVGFGILAQSLCSITNLNKISWQNVFAYLERFPSIIDSKGQNIKKNFEIEIIDEICYKLRKLIISPMDESLWCDVAQRLTRMLCNATAKALWDNITDKNSLLKVFFQIGMQACDEIRYCSNLRQLSFYPKFEGDSTGFSSIALSNLRQAQIGSPGKTKAKSEVLTKVGQNFDLADKKSTLTLHVELMAMPKAIECYTESQLLDGPARTGLHIQQNWYICWQVIYVIHAFSQTFLVDSSYSLKSLCSVLSIDADIVAPVIEEATRRASKTYRKDRKRKSSPPNTDKPPITKPKKEKKRKTWRMAKRRAPWSSQGIKGSTDFFWTILWTHLKDKCGWNLEHGSRPGDFYACPPGIKRGQGFKPRIDFFDSVKQVLGYVRTSPKWCNNPDVQKTLDEYDNCVSFYDDIHGTKFMPVFKSKAEMITWVRDRVAAEDGNKNGTSKKA